jgi:hypothetical protein
MPWISITGLVSHSLMTRGSTAARPASHGTPATLLTPRVFAMMCRSVSDRTDTLKHI